MEFEFTADQVSLRDSLRRLIEQEYSPMRRRVDVACPYGFDAEFWRVLARQGVFGLGLLAGFGGPREIMIVMEEMGRGLVLEPFMSTTVLGGGLIRDHGTVAQRAQWLSQIAAGDCRVALAHHETGGSSVLDHIGTSACRGKGVYVLNGSKAEILDAPVADLLIVSARDESAGGLSLFLVRPDAPGLTMTSYPTLDGRSAADLTLRDVTVKVVARLGSPGWALSSLELAVDGGIAALCASAVGAMEAVNEITLQSVKASHGHMTDMFLMSTLSKSVSYLATARCRQRERSERRGAISAARVYVGKAAAYVGQQALGIPGADTAELPIRQYAERLTQISVMLGTEDYSVGAFCELLRA